MANKLAQEERTRTNNEVSVLLARLRVFMATETLEKEREFIGKIDNFIRKVEGAYPEDEREDCQLWHVIAGRVIKLQYPTFDFPGELSIENFIRGLWREYVNSLNIFKS